MHFSTIDCWIRYETFCKPHMDLYLYIQGRLIRFWLWVGIRLQFQKLDPNPKCVELMEEHAWDVRLLNVRSHSVEFSASTSSTGRHITWVIQEISKDTYVQTGVWWLICVCPCIVSYYLCDCILYFFAWLLFSAFEWFIRYSALYKWFIVLYCLGLLEKLLPVLHWIVFEHWCYCHPMAQLLSPSQSRLMVWCSLHQTLVSPHSQQQHPVHTTKDYRVGDRPSCII